MKTKFYSFLFALALAIACAGNVWGQTLPNELQGLTPVDILQTGNSYSASVTFASAQDFADGRYGTAKAVLYRFTLTERSVVTWNANVETGSAMLYRSNGGGFSLYSYSSLTEYEEKTTLNPGTYLLLCEDSYYFAQNQAHPTVLISISKAAVPVTPISIPYSGSITLPQNGEKLLSFTLAGTKVLHLSGTSGDYSRIHYIIQKQNDNNWSLDGWVDFNYYDSFGDILLPAGSYYVILTNWGWEEQDAVFGLSITEVASTAVSIPHDQNYTLTGERGTSQWLKFTLAGEYLLTLQTTIPGVEPPAGNVNQELMLQAIVYNSAGNEVAGCYNTGKNMNVLPAGEYLVKLTKAIDGNALTFNLKLTGKDAGNIPSYTAIDYSAPLQKGALVSGALTQSSLGYYEINGEDYNEETGEYEMRPYRQYALLKGFTLNVEANREYSISNIASGTGVVVLKNGALSGNLIADILALNESSQTITFTAEETGTLRVLVVLFNDMESGAYTLKITEGGTGAPVITLSELCASATPLTYSASLSQTLAMDFNAQTPRVRVTFTGESEMSGLTWVSPAKAYKITIPAVNQGINIRAAGGYVCLYLKTGDEYQALVQTDGIEVDELPAEYAGEWYAVFVNEPFAPVSPFTASIWVNTPPSGSGTTVKQLLDNAPLVTLPHSSAGNTAADGTAVSQAELENSSIYVYRPSKVVAKKITLAAPAERLYVRSNFDYVALFKVNDGDDGDDGTVNPPAGVAQQSRKWLAPLRAAKNPLRNAVIAGLFRTAANANAGNDYTKIDYEWGGNLEYEESYYNESTGEYLYGVPAGDYWVIGIFEYSGDADYWLQITTAEPQNPTVTSITANAASIGVNAGASELEIKALLSLLKLTAHLSNGAAVPLENRGSYWTVAAGGQSATLNFDYIYTGYNFADNIQPLTVQIRYTGNDVPDVSGLNDVESAKLTVYNTGRQIYAAGIEAGTAYRLFDINGRLLAQGKASGATLELTVPQRGIYILRAGSRVVKVPVRQ